MTLPRHRHRRRMLVVLAVFTVLAVLAAGCSVIGAPEGYLVQARFPNTFNLFPGSPVRILGIERGIVQTLTVDEGSDTVVANMIMDPDVELPEEVRAVVMTDALLGERFVQLTPAYDGGPTFEPGSMIDEVGDVPAEFDELLSALNDFIVGIEDGDLPRLVDNLAEVLEGNGENIGQTLDATKDALDVLRQYDEDIIRLASKLSDVNETLNTRRNELGQVVQDFAQLSQVLADQRVPLDRSLSSLARLADETGRLLEANRTLIERDVETLTRVGRTAVRNLDHVSAMLLNSAELFRASERALDRERNWLPLVNNTDDFVNYGLNTIQDRLGALCEREGLPTETCEQLTNLVDGIAPDQICLPPLLACAEAEADTEQGRAPAPLGDVVTETLREGAEDIEGSSQDQQDAQEFIDDVIGGLTGGLGATTSGLLGDGTEGGQ